MVSVPVWPQLTDVESYLHVAEEDVRNLLFPAKRTINNSLYLFLLNDAGSCGQHRFFFLRFFCVFCAILREIFSGIYFPQNCAEYAEKPQILNPYLSFNPLLTLLLQQDFSQRSTDAQSAKHAPYNFSLNPI
jgi:hypothetical protein